MVLVITVININQSLTFHMGIKFTLNDFTVDKQLNIWRYRKEKS